jgi:hypothetical protein
MEITMKSNWEYHITPRKITINIIASSIKESREKMDIISRIMYGLKTPKYTSEWFPSLDYGVVSLSKNEYYEDWGMYD